MAKIVLVTGASSGLGVAISVLAAQAGHKVYATMRNLGKRAVLDAAVAEGSTSVEVLQLDVQDTPSIAKAVEQVISNEGRIDTLTH